jgi:hypothetical protein
MAQHPLAMDSDLLRFAAHLVVNVVKSDQAVALMRARVGAGVIAVQQVRDGVAAQKRQQI